jgi:hypothetical protein
MLACGTQTASNSSSQSGGFTGKFNPAGITREVLQHRAGAVTFGASPAPALRADSIYATIAVGIDHACIIATSGPSADQVLCWTSAAPTPAVVALPERAVQLAAGDAHTCALVASADVWCWGSNSNGQFGADPARLQRSDTPVRVPRSDDVTYSQLAAGGNSTCALTPDQHALCWGANGSGQLGIGTLVDTWEPTFIDLRSPLAHISIAGDHACAAADLDPVFSTWCWGNNSSGQIANTAGAKPAKVGTSLYADPVMVLHAYGPYPNHGYDGLEAMRRIALGARHSCALTNYGLEYCWGDNSLGQLGAGVGAAQTGNTPTYGATDFGVPFAMSVFQGAAQIVSGANHTCILAGGVSCWGDNSRGQMGTAATVPQPGTTVTVEPPDASAFTQLAAGGDQTCGATTSGELYCWGNGSSSLSKLPGGPWFDDLRTATAIDNAPPDGSAIVDCEPDLTIGIGPPLLDSYLFDLADVFSAAATSVTEVQLDLQVSLGTAFNEFELGVYAWGDGAYTLLGRSRVANALDTNVLRFHFPGGLQVPPGPVTMQVTQRAGQVLYNDSHSIVNAGTEACPTSNAYQIPVRIYAK